MNSLITVTPEAEKKMNEANVFLTLAEDFEVNSQENYNKAAKDVKDAKKFYKELEGERKKITAPLDVSKRAAMDLFRKPLDFLVASEAILKKKMLTYKTEQDRIVREAQEKERLRVAEEERKKREALEKRAKTAEEKGKEEKARILREQKEVVYVPEKIVPDITPKANGISTKKIWDFKIINKDLIPIEYLIINEKALKSLAVSMKGEIKIPGVEFFSREIMAVR